MITTIVIYFLYGLAFFSMGLLVALEGGRSSDERLRKALRPLAAFGIVHAVHEWLETFDIVLVQFGFTTHYAVAGVRLALLAFSFLSLAAFGSFLLAKSETAQRVSLIVPLVLETIWVFGLANFSGKYNSIDMLAVAQVWARYSLAIPASALAAVGLVAQQRAFRRAGLVRFGQDSLWASVAFVWYGLVGQLFAVASPLPPSNFINENLFQALFGFQVQIFRAITASAAAFFVIRFLRAFQVETDRKIAELQAARLQEAEQREVLRGELYRRVVEAQEAERQRIARDLHDETGQSLTAIGLGLRGLSTALTKNPQQAASTLHQLEGMTADALSELQRLIADLRPSHLDDLGLPATLRWYANLVKARTGLDVSIIISGHERTICPEYATSIFRIAQEALNNIIKHAQAAKVQIRLLFEAGEVRLGIEDDGRGFDVEKGWKQKSWGLLGMQERASLLDGQFYLHSAPGRGTLVEIVIPYCPVHREENSDDNSPLAGG